MIGEILSKKVLKQLSSLQLAPCEDEYAFRDTIKQQLLDSSNAFKIVFIDDKNFEVDIEVGEYSRAIFSDYYFGKQRINEQKKHLQTLLNSQQQVAWILVTAYYASFFMATEISKLFGKFMINFTTDEMKQLLDLSENNLPASYLDADTSNYAFQVQVAHSIYDEYVKLSFYKKSPKPHVEVWKNIANIITTIHKDVDDSMRVYTKLFLDICCEDNKSWHNPSRIRNDWNYKYASYYGDKGSILGETFFKNLKNYQSTKSWASYRALQPHEHNIAAGLSYVYHCLDETITKLDQRLGFET